MLLDSFARKTDEFAGNECIGTLICRLLPVRLLLVEAAGSRFMFVPLSVRFDLTRFFAVQDRG